jgi:hypothetical protein
MKNCCLLISYSYYRNVSYVKTDDKTKERQNLHWRQYCCYQVVEIITVSL